MSIYIGHEKLRTFLEKVSPDCFLLFGQPGVGKHPLASFILRHHGLEEKFLDISHSIPDDLMLSNGTILKVGSSRRIQSVIKSMVEHTENIRMFILCDTPPEPELASVCLTLPMGTLSERELVALYLNEGMEKAEAMILASLSDGVFTEPENADFEGAKRALSGLLLGIREADMNIVKAALAGWDADKQRILETFLTEVATRRFRIFADTASRNVLSPKLALDLMDRITSGSIPDLMLELVLRPIIDGVRRGEYSIPPTN